jgi:hypothetical protein
MPSKPLVALTFLLIMATAYVGLHPRTCRQLL